MISQLSCLVCEKNFPIPREYSNLRKDGHIKDIYCPTCKRMSKFVEHRVTNYDRKRWAYGQTTEGEKKMKKEVFILLIEDRLNLELEAFVYATKGKAWDHILTDAKELYGYLDEKNPYIGESACTDNTLYLQDMNVYYTIKSDELVL